MALPFTYSQVVWNAKAVTETVVLDGLFSLCNQVVFEITTTGFSGTIDFKGRLNTVSAYSNIPYFRQDQGTAQTPATAQLSLTTDTAVYRYVALGYWADLEVVMTRSAGTITLAVVGIDVVDKTPLVTTLGTGAAAIGKLAANSGVDIGDVDVTSISAGANIIGKVGIDQTTVGTTNAVVRTTNALSNSGVKSADAAIKASAGLVYWMTVSDTAALAIEINNSTAGAGTDVWALDLPAGGYGHFIFDPPIVCGTGIYLDVSTATCKVTIGYV